MLSDLMLRNEMPPAGLTITAGEFDPIRKSERQDAFVRAMMARTVPDRASARGSTRAPIITGNWLTSVVRAVGLSLITGAAIFFTFVLFSIYGGLPLFFA